MDSDGQMITGCVLIYLTLIFVLGYSVSIETALTNLNFSKNKFKLEEEEKYSFLLKKTPQLLTSLMINRVMLIIILSLYTYFTAHAVVFSYMLEGKDLSQEYVAQSLAFTNYFTIAFDVVVNLFMITIFAVIIPKALVSGRSEKFAVFNRGYIKFMYILFSPLRALSAVISKGVCAIFGLSSNSSKEIVTEEEIMMMVNASNENGGIEESQKEMISNIFEFADLEISDVMTHRTEIIAVEINTNISDLIDIAISSGKSRIPVYEEDIDSIIGLVNVKDLLKLIGRGHVEEFMVKDFIREIIYLPDTSSLDEAFKKLTAIKGQMAVAVDEYGGTAGIVTMEDILEEIVGNIQDEYDEEAEDIVKISDGIYTIEGSASPDEIFEELDIPAPSEREYETMSGFVTDLLGRIPDEDENPSVSYHGVTFTVLAVDDKKIVKIKALLPTDEEDDKQQGEN